MTAAARPAPNAVLPCRTESARRRHLAHGKRCRVCWPGHFGLPAVPSDADYQAVIGGAA